MIRFEFDYFIYFVDDKNRLGDTVYTTINSKINSEHLEVIKQKLQLVYEAKIVIMNWKFISFRVTFGKRRNK